MLLYLSLPGVRNAVISPVKKKQVLILLHKAIIKTLLKRNLLFYCNFLWFKQTSIFAAIFFFNFKETDFTTDGYFSLKMTYIDLKTHKQRRTNAMKSNYLQNIKIISKKNFR